MIGGEGDRAETSEMVMGASKGADTARGTGARGASQNTAVTVQKVRSEDPDQT